MNSIFSYVGLGLIGLFLFTSCQKEPVQSAKTDGPVPMVRPPVVHKVRPADKELRPASICISTFKQLLGILAGTSIDIQYVILDDGSTVQVGGSIARMTYGIRNVTEPHSLFRSTLQVDHTTYGTVQTHFQEIWSLGCVYTHAGSPPFTNLVFGGEIFTINTAFTWSVPPLGTAGHRVVFIVAR